MESNIQEKTVDSGFLLLKNESENSMLISETDRQMLSLEDNNLIARDKDSSINNLITEENTLEINYDKIRRELVVNTQPEINWKVHAINGNFMPAVVKLYRKEINVNEIVDDKTENKLIHLAVSHSFLNVSRCLIENFESELNLRNGEGQTLLHLICSNRYKDAYLLSYFIKNDLLQIDVSDKSGLSPLIYAIINKFNVAVLALIHLKANLSHVDYLGNNSLYFSICSDNKFAMKLLIKHLAGLDLNDSYYKKQATLSDILITTKNSSCTKHLLRYHHNEINLSSFLGCKKTVDKFPVYNKFNYDLLNTVYYYKSKDFKGFIFALFRKDGYSYRIYNLWFFLYDLLISNTNKFVKIGLLWIYSILLSYLFYYYYLYIMSRKNVLPSIFSLENLFYVWQLISVLILFIVMIKFTFNKYIKDFYLETQNDLSNSQHASENVCYQIYQAMDRNPFDLIFEEEICEVCLIKHDTNVVHCNMCKKCVKEFYFHSKFLNICFSRQNINYYILLLYSFCVLNFSILYMVVKIVDIDSINFSNNHRKHTIYSSSYFTTNFLLFLSNSSICRLFLSFIYFISFVLFLQKTLTLIFCIGYKTTYYNMYRYHKRSVGVLQQRINSYYNIPQMNLIPLKEFFKNLFF